MKVGKPWERGWAIVGIVGGFIFYILPGVIALWAYRRWQRGEGKRPTWLIVWGIAWVALYGLLFLLLVLGAFYGGLSGL